MLESLSEGENARRMTELSSEALSFMEDYLGYSIEDMSEPVFLGLERHCVPRLRELAQSVFEEKCERKLLRLKGKPIRENEWDRKRITYFNGSDMYAFFPWDFSRKNLGLLNFKAREYFQTNSAEITRLFINERYGSVVTAIEQTHYFTQIIKEFVKWFDKRREKFLEDMSTAIAEVKKFQMADKPQSHGGVANLLKVLTKTMEKQGADITNIAKVQYAVCVQAGIYIPSEFIQDVAVAMDVIKEAGNG